MPVPVWLVPLAIPARLAGVCASWAAPRNDEGLGGGASGVAMLASTTDRLDSADSQEHWCDGLNRVGRGGGSQRIQSLPNVTPIGLAWMRAPRKGVPYPI